MGIDKYHPLRRIKTIYDAEKRIEHRHNVNSRQEAERAGLVGKKRKRALDAMAKMKKKRKMIPYTPAQMQGIHRVTVAGMKNRKIMRKGPS